MAGQRILAARDAARDLVDFLQEDVIALAGRSAARGLSLPEFLGVRRLLDERKSELGAAFASLQALQQGV